MVVLLLFSSLLIFGAFSFFVGKRKISILIFFFFLTNGFQLIPENLLSETPINKYLDFSLIYIVIICFWLRLKHKDFFRLSDRISRYLVLIMVYMLFELIITVFTGGASVSEAIKVFRNHLFLLAYFFIRKLSFKEINYAIKLIVYITIFTTVLYTLQVVFKHQILVGDIEGLTSNLSGSSLRYRNTPIFIYFALYFVLFYYKKIKYREIYLIFLFIGLVGPVARGVIVSFGIAILINFMLKNQIVLIARYLLLGCIIGIVLWPFVANRFEKENTGSDLEKAFKLRNAESFDASGDGNFSFRIALLVERIDYLKLHPEYILTGIGLRHEDSKRTIADFNFLIGANKLDSDGKTFIRQQIETSDLVYATMILRYGLIGLFIYLILFGHLLYFFFQNSKISESNIAFLFLVMLLLNSFATDMLIRNSTFTVIFFVYVYVNKFKIYSKYPQIKSC